MGIIDKLKQEIDLSAEWLGFEIHTGTPQEDKLQLTLFPQLDFQNMFRHLRDTKALYGISFADIACISNSRMSLEASEFAKERGRFDQFHSALFRTCFSEGMNIGSREVLAQIGHVAGLDREALAKALQSGKFLPMIEHIRQKASRLAVTALPTFIFEDNNRIVGAQPSDMFRNKLRGYC
jgi:predicted DsbA family dithiol-disulfide isomerase